MNRREFIKGAILTAAFLSSGQALAYNDEEEKSGELAEQDLLRLQNIKTHFKRQVRNHRTQIRVAAALTYAVDGSLHVRNAIKHGGDRVGDGKVAVVVAMDAEAGPGKLLVDGPHSFGDLRYSRAAVGVAHAQAGGAGV